MGALYGQVGLESRVFLGAFHALMKVIGADIIAAFRADPAEAFEKFASLKKVCFFDIGIIVDLLIAERERTINAQQEVISELSAVSREPAHPAAHRPRRHRAGAPAHR